MREYETVIGIEVHVELNTKTKIFCCCENRFGGEANIFCCPICTGMPGTLPVLNKKVIDYAIATGLALNCNITHNIMFDRKNYFYPDLPKAYQISQLYFPICTNGYLDINVDNVTKRIHIHEIHMEEDAGKLIHNDYNNTTLIDYNRCGVPLLEIVSEPDIHSSDDAIAYLESLKSILQYLGVSDCKMQEGSMRADINLSVKYINDKQLGVRTEMKNINSFKAVVRAIDSERKRQIEILENGENVIQQTRRWDDNQKTSYLMRKKEDFKQYRYFPEPDIPPIHIGNDLISNIKTSLPEMPYEKKIRYINEYKLSEYEANIIISSKYLADIFEKTLKICKEPKETANIIIGDVMRMLKETNTPPENITFSVQNIAKLIIFIKSGTINRTIGREVFDNIFLYNVEPEKYIEENNLKIIKNDDIIRITIDRIINSNPQVVQDYIRGKDKSFKFFMGEIMKELKGKADPKIVNNILNEMLQYVKNSI